MNAFKSKSVKFTPKIVLLVPCLVIFAACASKEIQNASLEPVDLPAEGASYDDTYNTDAAAPSSSEPEFSAPAAPAAAKIKKSKKSGGKGFRNKKVAHARHGKKKYVKQASKTPSTAAVAQVQNTETLPTIGDETLASAPIAMPPMAPPVPFETEMGNEADSQPNWLLSGLLVAGLIGAAGIALRVRKLNKGKRSLVYNA